MYKVLIFCFWATIIGLLIYTRFVGLDWGLPYPMHPDERNMAVAIQSLNCEKLQVTNYKLQDCFNPHFFAYGQFPLYLGRFIIFVLKFFNGDLKTPVGFGEAIMSLRIISAIASIINVFIIFKILQLFLRSFNSESKIQNSKFNSKSRIIDSKSILNYRFLIVNLILVIFSPYAIQFSHFGTTESLLMLFYSLIIYFSLKIITNKNQISNIYYLISIVSGLAIATKMSAVIFLTVPTLAIILINARTKLIKKHFFKNTITIVSRSWGQWLFFISGVIIFSLIFSPHNLLNLNEFLGAIRYEGDVALGRYVAFYTRQFEGAIPIIFQFIKIFPYALGWPQFILAILGFIFLPWKNKEKKDAFEHCQSINIFNFLRFAFLIYFLPNAFIFAKWTRFMAPILPILSIFAILFLFYAWNTFYNWIKSKQYFKIQKFLIYATCYVLCVLCFIPGLAYLSIYTNTDVHFQASNWIFKNIPTNSYVLSETANVVDIPIPSSNYSLPPTNYNLNYISFNFYDLDISPLLQEDLKQHLEKADYIFIPSRRIWANHTCQSNFKFSPLRQGFVGQAIFNFQSIFNSKCLILKQKYPLLNKYYEDLFSGKLGFTQVAEFSAYPNIKLQVMSYKFNIAFPDETAEETWSVFDHPTIRIFKKNSYQYPISNIQYPNKFINYQTTNYSLTTNHYSLLLADTPQKWQLGLMNVRSKEEIQADGMIFNFGESNKRIFWNKNTLVDLDLYWISNGKVVGQSYLPAITKTKNIVTVESPDKVDQVVEIIQ